MYPPLYVLPVILHTNLHTHLHVHLHAHLMHTYIHTYMHTQTHTQITHSRSRHSCCWIWSALPDWQTVGTISLHKPCISIHGLWRHSRFYISENKVTVCSPFCCLVSLSPLPHTFLRWSTELITRTTRYRWCFALCVPELGILFHGSL